MSKGPKDRQPCKRCRQADHTPACVELRQFRNLWIFVTVITLAMIAVTVTLNVMHAPPSWGARAVGGLPPVFVFFCIEMVARIPGTGRWLSAGRITASIVVAALSFAISYQQQMEFVVSLGFVGWIAYVFPVIIDGVMIVSTLSLVEVTRKVRALRHALATTLTEAHTAAVASLSVPVVPATPAPVAPTTRNRGRRSAPRTSAKVPTGVKPAKAGKPTAPVSPPVTPVPAVTGDDVADVATVVYAHDVSTAPEKVSTS